MKEYTMTYTITLTVEQMQVIGKALGELPFKTAAPLISELNQQMAGQNKPQAVMAEAAE